MWRAQGLANPESAALSADRNFLYVTNVNGDGAAKDGNGFIARVGLDGRPSGPDRTVRDPVVS